MLIIFGSRTILTKYKKIKENWFFDFIIKIKKKIKYN